MSRIAFVLVFAGVATTSYFFTVSSAAQSTQQPYTVIVEETSSNQKNGHEHGRRRYMAYRSDGARASGPYGDFNDRTAIREVVVPAAGYSVVINDFTKTKSTFYAPLPTKAVLVPAQDPTEKCQSKAPKNGRLKGEEVIQGLRSFLYEQTAANSDSGDVQLHVWLAPEVGCKPIREIGIKFDGQGKELARFIRTVSEYRLIEPDPALFSVPGDYREVKPSEQNRIVFETVNPGGTMPRAWIRSFQIIDQKYDRGFQFRRQTSQ